ncbi:MAG TPA: ATP-dependent helicase, partial [Gemmatimonadaceae bacterium]|nr:ATP-dependent helicase [Gemmatimonadaceae bacterium]
EGVTLDRQAHALSPAHAGLNAEQRAAVAHGDGPLLVVAGAGTGKTRTLVHRVASLIERGVPAERILLLTFTRRAADEMLARVERLTGQQGRRVQGGTFHGTAHQVLRQFGQQAGIAEGFTILDQGDAEDLMQLARAALGLGARERRFPKKETLLALYSRHINTDRTVEDLVRDGFPQYVDDLADIGRVFAEYVERKAARNLVDYDDLLLFWAAMLETDPLGEAIRSRYQHVLVDEYQDTNTLQSRILRGLCASHANVTVVGDDAQSIYAFRGATVRNILDFPGQFPGTTIITLDRNYRSTQPILDTANAVLVQATEGYRKQLRSIDDRPGELPWLVPTRDEQAQTMFTCDRLLQLVESEGLRLDQVAVLVRAGYMSADLEIELAARRIPFEKWGGIKFLEAAHVKDMLAFLRVAENPRDEVSWFRLLQLLPGIGEISARRAIASLEEASWQVAGLRAWTPPPRAIATHASLTALMERLAASSGADPGTDIALVRGVYDDILRHRFDDAEVRLNDLVQLEHIASGYPNRGAFLSALALEPPSATSDLAQGRQAEDDDALVISTIHSAKGKEWEAVFVIWAADGWIPSARSVKDTQQVEQERRLFYVALTRAKRHLHVSYPLYAYASRWSADFALDQKSRFLDAGVLTTMQRIQIAAPAAPEPPPGPVAPTSTLDLRAALRSRFS